MKKTAFIFVFLLTITKLFSQGIEWRMSVMGGVNKVYIGSQLSAKRPGPSTFCSTGLIFKNRKSTFSFEPSLAYGRNTYALETTNSYIVDAKQNSYLSLMALTGFKVSNNIFYKIGCMVNVDMMKQGNRLYAQYNPNISNTVDFEMPPVYYPTETQVSLVSGFTLYCDKEQKIAFDIQAQQNLNGVLNQNFYVEQHFQNNNGSILIANKKSKPLVLLVGINIKLSTVNCFKSTRSRYHNLRTKSVSTSQNNES